jgi:hypothetical protein
MFTKSVRRLGSTRFLTVLVTFLLFAAVAQAELQQVSVGGELRIRGRWYMNTFTQGFARETRIPNAWLGKRPIGFNGVSSIFAWDGDTVDWARYESSVLLDVKAEFTDNIGAVIELYDFHQWGEDFRSNYITGNDFRATTSDDVEINQAYIHVRSLFDSPIGVVVGRQRVKLGKGWLISDMLTPSQYISHDGILLHYLQDPWAILAFTAKPLETMGGDDDADIYGMYGTWAGMDALALSGYWMLLRHATGVEDTYGGLFQEWLEDRLDIDDYDATKLHTVGMRAFGMKGGWDYDLEVAYQFGEADHTGAMFRPVGMRYGDDDAEYDNWGAQLDLGYTFQETAWSPRLLMQACYFQGHDNRDISFWGWINPFYTPEASVSFNRLLSSENHVPTINDNGWLSNFYQITGGVELQPTEKITLHMHVAKEWIDEPFDFPVFPGLPFWTREGSDDLGWEIAAWAKYNYSDDLSFMLYGNVLFPDDGLTDGAFIQFNGTDFSGGSDNDTAGYLFWMSTLKF